MIFGSVGSHSAPFDRFIEQLEWLAASGIVEDTIVVQTGTSRYPVLHCESFAFCDRTRFHNLLAAARIIICHGGIGTILSGVRLGKRVIVVPRLAGLGEHNSDHQADICDELLRSGIVEVARNCVELAKLLSQGAPVTATLQPPETALSHLAEAITRCMVEASLSPLTSRPDLIVVLAGDKPRRHPVLHRLAQQYPDAAVMVTGTRETLDGDPQTSSRLITCEATNSTYGDANVSFHIARSGDLRQLIIVTSRSHRRRASAVFKKRFEHSGISLVFVVADDGDQPRREQIKVLFWEMLKSVAYRLRGLT
jgi:UDP-N-acetylglucosamine transferase subunit ALG13